MKKFLKKNYSLTIFIIAIIIQLTTLKQVREMYVSGKNINDSIFLHIVELLAYSSMFAIAISIILPFLSFNKVHIKQNMLGIILSVVYVIFILISFYLNTTPVSEMKPGNL